MRMLAASVGRDDRFHGYATDDTKIRVNGDLALVPVMVMVTYG